MGCLVTAYGPLVRSAWRSFVIAAADHMSPSAMRAHTVPAVAAISTTRPTTRIHGVPALSGRHRVAGAAVTMSARAKPAHDARSRSARRRTAGPRRRTISAPATQTTPTSPQQAHVPAFVTSSTTCRMRRIVAPPSCDDRQNEPKEAQMAEFPAPEKGIVLTHFIVSDDVERSRRFYTEVLGGRLAFSGPGGLTYVALSNSWIIINGGGGPTDDKPSVSLETPRDPDRVSSFLNIRVKDIEAV